MLDFVWWGVGGCCLLFKPKDPSSMARAYSTGDSSPKCRDTNRHTRDNYRITRSEAIQVSF